MNLLLFNPEQRDENGGIQPDARQERHLRDVLGVAAGDRVRVGQLHGAVGEAVVTEDNGRLRLVDAQLDQAPPPKLPLTLLLALPRPKMLRRLLQGATSLGVARIVLVNAWRVEKSYWQSPFLQPEAIRENLQLGLEQARDTVPPEVWLRPRFKPFVEDELPALSRHGGWVAHPQPQADAIPTRPCGPEARVLAIGPEGGFIDYEVRKLVEAGLQPWSLGPRILRVDTAVPALIARLCY